MTYPGRRAITAVFLLIGAPASARAQAPTPEDSIVATRHQAVIGGKAIRYTARAGLIPLRENDTGEIMARMFFVSYTAEPTPGAPARPLTFLWNGGPGSNAGQVHVVGFGPKRVRTADSYPAWGPNTETEHRDAATQWMPLIDPSLLPMLDLMQGTSRLFNSYLRDTLKYRNDLLYRGPFGGAFHPRPLVIAPNGFAEDWMTNMWNRGGRAAQAGAPATSEGSAGGRGGRGAPAKVPIRRRRRRCGAPWSSIPNFAS